jgi:hypothetical protein
MADTPVRSPEVAEVEREATSLAELLSQVESSPDVQKKIDAKIAELAARDPDRPQKVFAAVRRQLDEKKFETKQHEMVQTNLRDLEARVKARGEKKDDVKPAEAVPSAEDAKKWEDAHLEVPYRILCSNAQGADDTVSSAMETLRAGGLELIKTVKGQTGCTQLATELQKQIDGNANLTDATRQKLRVFKGDLAKFSVPAAKPEAKSEAAKPAEAKPDASKPAPTMRDRVREAKEAAERKLKEAAEKAKAAVSPKKTETPPAVHPGVADSANTDVTSGPWFPQSLDPREWSSKQIATAATLTVGAVGIYALWRHWRSKKGAEEETEDEETTGKSKAKKKEKKGWFKKMLPWIPVVGLGAIGLYAGHKMLMRFENYAKMFGNAQEQMDAFKKKAQAELDEAKRMLPGHGEWEKYGVDKDAFLKAKDVYRIKGEHGRAEIAKIFGLKDGETSPQFELFMKDMGERYKGEKRNNINYSRASVALENYETDIGTAVIGLEKWVENHAFEVMVGTLVAARLGILQAIIRGAGTALQKAVQLTKALAMWGIKHPFISLFALAGSIYGLKKLKDNVELPSNLKELSLACTGTNTAMAINAQGDVGKEELAAVQSHMKILGAITEDFDPWVGRQVTSLMKLVGETVPDMIKLTDEELIAKNNCGGMDALRHTLEMKKRGVKTDAEQRESGLGVKLEEAITLLDDFKTAFIQARCTDHKGTDEAPAALEKLKAALAAVEITVSVQDGVVIWKTAEMDETYDLCVDPSMTNRAELKLKSERLRHGQFIGTYLATHALDQIRQMENKAMQAGEKLTDNKAGAMVVGHLVYIFDDWRNAKDYVVVPLDLFLDTIGVGPKFGSLDKSRPGNWSDWTANVTKGMLTCTFFAIPVNIAARVKRFMIGGGPTATLSRRIAFAVTPGLSQWQAVSDIVNFRQELEVMRQFDFLQARRINRICGSAKIRPQWISIIQTTDDFDTLKGLAKELGLSIEKGATVSSLRKTLENEIRTRLRAVKSHKITDTAADVATGHWVRAVKGRKFGGAETMFEELKYTFAKVEDLQRLKGGGVTLAEMVEGGVSTRQLVKVWKVDDLIAAKVAIEDLIKAGADVAELKAAGATLEQLVKGGVADAQRVSAGFSQTSVDAARHALKAPKVVPGKGPVFSALLSGSTEAQNVLKTLKLSPQLEKALEDSPEFARLFIKQLEGGKDASKLISELNNVCKTAQEAEYVATVMRTETGFSRVAADIARGKEVATALRNASKISRFTRVAKAAKFGLKAVPLVFDALAIYGSVVEMIELHNKLSEQKRLGVSQDVMDLTAQRYYYLGAELGVSIVGAGASICFIVGVGSAVAGPVALATLPISAVIYGAYEGHKWQEDQARSSEDWAKEYDLVTLLTDVRSYDFGERVGHAWDQMGGWTMFIPIYGQVSATYRALSSDVRKDLMDRIQKMDRKKLEAIVAHTSTVTVPTSMKGEDGKERPLTAQEQQQYKEMLTRYVEAKTEFLLSFREDGAHAIRSSGDVTDMLQGAESHALLLRDRPQLEAKRKQLEEQAKTDPAARKHLDELSAVLDEKDMQKQAILYGKLLREDQMASMYLSFGMQLTGMDKEKREGTRPYMEKAIAGYLCNASNNAYINLCVQCEEANMVEWWPDGNAQTVTKLYAAERMQEIAKEKAGPITSKLIANAENPTEVGESEYMRAMDEALHDIERFLSNPKGIYGSIPEAKKGQLGMKFQDKERVEVSEKFKKRQELGEAVMYRVGANYHGDYYTKQYGVWLNSYMYITFDAKQGKWMSVMGNSSDFTYQDPDSYVNTEYGISGAGGADNYNKLREALVAINQDREPGI